MSCVKRKVYKNMAIDLEDVKPTQKDIENVEEAQVEEYKSNLKGFYGMLKANNLWNLDSKGVNAVKAAMSMLSTKTGMYARIPLYCKGDCCPYADTCQILQYGIQPEGQACPVEIAQIQTRYYEYAKEFELESDETSFTDKNLVSELITLEIYMERCKGLMAKEGNPIQQIVAGITERGEEILQPVVSKAWDAYKDLSKKRDSNYQLLMSTRKDKKSIKGEEAIKSASDILEDIEDIPDFYDIELENPTGEGNPISAEPSSQNSIHNRGKE